jgi:hypothetical protein
LPTFAATSLAGNAGRMLTFTWVAIFSGLIYYSVPLSADAMRLRLNVHYSNTAFFLLM